jgi:hypothetical protein
MAVDPNLFGYSDDLPLTPPDATPARSSIAEQQRQHAEQNPPPPGSDDLPLSPAPAPSILNSSWSQIGKRLWDEGSRGALLGTRAVAEGLSSPLTGAADIATWPMRAIQRGIGIPTSAPSTMAQQAIDATGLPAPQTPGERATSTFVSGAASALPSLAMGGAPTLLNAARIPLQGGVGAIAGQAASQSDLVPEWLKPSVALLAGMAGAKGADIGTNLLAKGGNAVAGNTNDIYNAFRRLGMDTNLVGTVTGSEGARSAEAAAMRMPFASSIVRPVAQNAVDRFGHAVDDTANRLDPTRTAVNAQQAGETLQAAARDWKDNVFPQQVRQAWDPLDQRMAGASVSPSGYRSALDDVTTQLGLPATQQVLTPALATSLREALTQDVGGNMTWTQAQRLRTLIGQTMGVPEISQSVGADVLKRAYAGIAGDMRTTAAQHGQEFLFDQANHLTTDGHAFINGPLAKVISTNNPAQERIMPEQAANSVLNSGDTTLQAIRQRLPDAADQLAAYKLRQMQMAKPSVAGSYDDTSTGTFLSNAVRMRQNQPGGYDALFNAPDIQQRLDDLQTAAGALRKTQQHLNTSGTAETLGWMDYLRGIREGMSSGGAKERMLNAAGAVVLPPTVGWGGGHMVTNPGLTRYLAAQGAAPSPVPPRVAGILGNVPQMVGGQ